MPDPTRPMFSTATSSRRTALAPRRLGWAGVALAVGALVAACSPCGSLEDNICQDLGADDCQVWRDADRPGLPNGRRAFRSCVNASFGTQYDLTLQVARATVDAVKKAQP